MTRFVGTPAGSDLSLMPLYYEGSSDALEQFDEQVYEAYEQVEEHPKDLHYDVSDLVEGSRPEQHQGQDQYHRYDQ